MNSAFCKPHLSTVPTQYIMHASHVLSAERSRGLSSRHVSYYKQTLPTDVVLEYRTSLHVFPLAV